MEYLSLSKQLQGLDREKVWTTLLNIADRIEDAVDEDREVTIGGNGVNCCEASAVISGLIREAG